MSLLRRFSGRVGRAGPALCVLLVAAGTFVGSAYAAGSITYHDMGVFHVGDQYTGSYDSSPDRWVADDTEKSCSGGDCWGRVAFVQTDGSWVFSHTDTDSVTVTFMDGTQATFTKKPLCRNDAAFLIYNAKCVGTKD